MRSQVIHNRTGGLTTVLIAKLVLGSARVHLLAFHFYGASARRPDPNLLKTYQVACEFIELGTRLDDSEDFAIYTTHYFARSIMLAGYIVFRISRCQLRDVVGARNSEDIVFKSIRFSKRRSMQSGDLDARNALILTQLWASDNVFKRKDGSKDSIEILLRSRLVSHKTYSVLTTSNFFSPKEMSVVFDCFWWWRAEFLGQPNPYVEQSESSRPLHHPNTDNPASPSLETAGLPPGAIAPIPEDALLPTPMFGYSDFPDWEWAAGFTLPPGLAPPMPLLE